MSESDQFRHLMEDPCFEEDLEGVPYTETIMRLSLDAITRTNHNKWLAAQDRGYSPYGKRYDELTAEEKRQVSLTVKSTLEYLAAAGAMKDGFDVVDDIGDPAPFLPEAPAT